MNLVLPQSMLDIQISTVSLLTVFLQLINKYDGVLVSLKGTHCSPSFKTFYSVCYIGYSNFNAVSCLNGIHVLKFPFHLLSPKIINKMLIYHQVFLIPHSGRILIFSLFFFSEIDDLVKYQKTSIFVFSICYL